MTHPKMDKPPHSTIRLQIASQNDKFKVKDFLKRHKQSRVQSDDLAFIMRFDTPLSQAIIGVAKLKSLSKNTFWLHGLYICPSQRKQGYASQLLLFIATQVQEGHLNPSPNINQVFAFPLAHLKHFYLKNNYQFIEPSCLPNALNHRYQNAKKQQKNWLCMVLKLERPLGSL